MILTMTEYKGTNKPWTGKVMKYRWEDFCWKISHPLYYGMLWDDFIDESFPSRFNKKDYDKAKAEGRRIEWWESRQGIKEHNGGFVFGEIALPEGEKMGRLKDYFQSRNGITFDYEKCGSAIYERVKNGLDGWTYCFYTTCKHNPSDNDYRLRVVIPFAKTVNKYLFFLITDEFAKKIGKQGIDKTCIQADRMMLYPVVIKQDENCWKDFQAGSNDGKWLDVEQYFLDKYGTLEIKELAEKINFDYDLWSCPDLKEECREKFYQVGKIGSKTITYHNLRNRNSRNHEFIPEKPKRGNVISCFNACYSCREILLTNPDYEEDGDRFRYVKGEGTAGIEFRKGGTRIRSYHSTDPLSNGHEWSAFNLWVKFNCDENESFIKKLRAAHKYASESEKGKKYEKLYYYGKL